jgi:hypothetical protein
MGNLGDGNQKILKPVLGFPTWSKKYCESPLVHSWVAGFHGFGSAELDDADQMLVAKLMTF